MVATVSAIDDRLTHNEKFLKIYSDDLKNMKNMLRKELATSTGYEFMKQHVEFVTFKKANERE